MTNLAEARTQYETARTALHERPGEPAAEAAFADAARRLDEAMSIDGFRAAYTDGRRAGRALADSPEAGSIEHHRLTYQQHHTL